MNNSKIKFLVVFLASFTVITTMTACAHQKEVFAEGELLATAQKVHNPSSITPVDDSYVYLPQVLGPGLESVRFTHGVASGDVDSDGAVVWTRTDRPTELMLELAKDPAFAQITLSEEVATTSASDNTVKTQVKGLDANQTYYFRWVGGTDVSPTGRFRTPATSSQPISVSFAYSGDSDGTLVDSLPFHNEFEVLEAARADNPDFFIYLGDTIYSDSNLRPSGPAITLDEYRESYKVNRSYQALQDLMAATSFYAMWDDHEVYNDYAGEIVSPERYATGRQAFLDYMPVLESTVPSEVGCAGAPMFKVFKWGADIDLILLDERSCRSVSVIDQCTPAGATIPDLAPALPSIIRLFAGLPAKPPAGCLDALNDSDRTMLGSNQKALLKQELSASTAKYKLVINEVPLQQLYALPYDRWEGYSAERTEILNFIRDNDIENVIFLTTDAHANAMNDVYIDLVADSETIAYEVITGPIATTTFEESIVALMGEEIMDTVNELLDTINLDCRHLDKYGYGYVGYDVESGELTIALKDENGDVISDQSDESTMCTKTFGP